MGRHVHRLYLGLAFFGGVIAAGAPALAQPPTGAAVTGFGGFFFRSENPEALMKWYHEMLGVAPPPTSYEATPWRQEAGITIFSAYPGAIEQFGSPEKAFLLNFRTANLDGLVAHLRDHNVEVEMDETLYPNGRFAHLKDPDGNPIQLWEPAVPQDKE